MFEILVVISPERTVLTVGHVPNHQLMDVLGILDRSFCTSL